MTIISRQIMSATDMQRSLDRIVLQILEQNNGVENLAVVGIHTGGVFLAERIKKIIAISKMGDPCEFIHFSSFFLVMV